MCKEDLLFIHFSESEVTTEVKEVLLNYISERHPTVAIDKELFIDFLINMRNYIGGQSYPIMKLCHYFCENCIEDVQKGFPAIDFYLRDSNFLKSVPMEIIKSRCLQISVYLKEALVYFFLRPNELTSDNKFILFKTGYVENNTITSNLFLQLLLADSNIVTKIDDFVPKNIDDILVFAISDFKTHMFFDPITGFTSYERSIGTYFAALISRLPGIYLKPEMQFWKSDSSKRGSLPCVDLYLNSEFDVCIELLKNEDHLEEHLDRFISITGSYKLFKDNFVLLNFRFENKHPILSKLPKHYEYLIDKIYTFDYYSNSLYRGKTIFRENICKAMSYPTMGPTLNKIISDRDRETRDN
jgi:hypothetical protein